MKPKKVITYGTFDTIHYGHIRLLKRAKALGDELYVGVSTDEFNALKGKTAFLSYDERVELLQELRCVDVVFPEENWEQKIEDVRKYGIDVFVIGADWEGKFDFLRPYCEVIYLPRTPYVSSTGIRGLKQGE